MPKVTKYYTPAKNEVNVLHRDRQWLWTRCIHNSDSLDCGALWPEKDIISEEVLVPPTPEEYTRLAIMLATNFAPEIIPCEKCKHPRFKDKGCAFCGHLPC